jgi:hypothetical protein
MMMMMRGDTVIRWYGQKIKHKTWISWGYTGDIPVEFQLLFVDSRPLAFILGGSGDTIAVFFFQGARNGPTMDSTRPMIKMQTLKATEFCGQVAHRNIWFAYLKMVIFHRYWWHYQKLIDMICVFLISKQSWGGLRLKKTHPHLMLSSWWNHQASVSKPAYMGPYIFFSWVTMDTLGVLNCLWKSYGPISLNECMLKSNPSLLMCWKNRNGWWIQAAMW